MKRVRKPVLLVVAILILLFTFTSVWGISGRNGDNKVTYIKGVSDIRWGIDIKGGVEATFVPSTSTNVTKNQVDAAEAVIKRRLISKNIVDYEIYKDYNHKRIIVRFPWKSDEQSFNPESEINELAVTGELTFREGKEYSSTATGSDGSTIYKTPSGTTASNVILLGSDIESASSPVASQAQTTGKITYAVPLKLTSSGTKKFAEATEKLKGQTISIWMDDEMVSWPTVNSVISDGSCEIEGIESASEAAKLANTIEGGALPFKLTTDSYSAISPTLGSSSLMAMLKAGIIALILVSIMMVCIFRFPGVLIILSILGQTALTFALISGYFPFANGFTMTLPGLAGIILSVGMGVDAGIITASRIKEELWNGKTLDSAVYKGCQDSFWAIFDVNITVMIVAILLILVFGPKNILSSIFAASTTGLIYSFGITLFAGVIGNFIMGVYAVRVMLKASTGFKCLHKPWLFGGAKK